MNTVAMKQAKPRKGNLRGIHACYGDAVFKVLMLYPVLDPVLQNCLCERNAERNRPSNGPMAMVFRVSGLEAFKLAGTGGASLLAASTRSLVERVLLTRPRLASVSPWTSTQASIVCILRLYFSGKLLFNHGFYEPIITKRFPRPQAPRYCARRSPLSRRTLCNSQAAGTLMTRHPVGYNSCSEFVSVWIFSGVGWDATRLIPCASYLPSP